MLDSFPANQIIYIDQMRELRLQRVRNNKFTENEAHNCFYRSFISFEQKKLITDHDSEI